MSLTPKLLSCAVLLAISAAASAARTDDPAVGRAHSLLAAKASAVRASGGDSFSATDVVIDANGSEHVRFNRSYNGLPVIFGDVVVHSSQGRFASASMTLRSSVRPSLQARINADDAIVAAGADFGSGFEGVPSANKVVYARGDKPLLAFEVRMMGTKADQTPTDMRYYIDASNGRILDKWDTVHTGKPSSGGGGSTTPAVGIGQTFGYGDVTLNTAGSGSSFNLTDTTRGGGAVYEANNAAYSTAARRAVLFTDSDNNWGNNTLSDRATVAADAHYGVSMTWDYYQSAHGRNGIFNDGKGVRSYVHVGNGWVNAAWYANAMYYGDGGGSYLPLTSLDIAGHEMSHGVNQASAGLVYSGDAGGLNEANSDIFGTMVEFYANSASDPADYLIGEEIYASNPNGTKALRYMFRPGDADANASYNCYPVGGLGGVDPHYSSGPANHFFYLLAEGAVNPAGFSYTASQLVCNGDTGVSGIGRTAAQRIWYRALTVYMTSGTTYPQARTATINAANDLYGAGSAQATAVARAWTAINVN